MQISQNWKDIAQSARGASCVMGNFDGVHLGHQAVLDIARQSPAPLGVITFEPHPRQFFAPNGADFRLMNRQSRANQLKKLGVAHLFEVEFDANLASLSPKEFAFHVLYQSLAISRLVVGADFRFGKNRAGDAQDLVALGQLYGFETVVAQLRSQGDARISSTAIRTALAEGKPREAAVMLGHWHRIDGPVLHGEKRGRDLGYPTANMALDGLHLPKFGVYAVLADVLDGPHTGQYHGAASLGTRPMFGENRPNLETHLFDFKGDLYGAQLSIALVDYLRPELRFDGVDGLIAQMQSDCDTARAILTALKSEDI